MKRSGTNRSKKEAEFRRFSEIEREVRCIFVFVSHARKWSSHLGRWECVCLPVCLSVCLSTSLSVYLSVCLCIYAHVRLCVCVFTCLRTRVVCIFLWTCVSVGACLRCLYVCMEHTHTIERKRKSRANTVARGRAAAERFDLHSKTERWTNCHRGRAAAEGFSPTSPRAHWIGPE